MQYLNVQSLVLASITEFLVLALVPSPC